VAPVLPKMTADLAHDAGGAYLVKMVAGIIGLAILVGGPLSGLLADKAPRRRLLIASGTVFALAGVAPFLIDNLFIILATRFLTGLAATAIYVGGAALVGDCFEELVRARWMGRFEAVAMVVGVAALPLAGLLGDQGWRLTFLMYLIVGAPFVFLAWRTPEPQPRRRPARHSVDTRTDAAQLDGAHLRRHLPLGLVVLGTLIGVITYIPSMYIPFHLSVLGARSPSAIGGLLMISIVVSSIVSTQFGRARQILSSAAAFSSSFGAMAVGVGIIAWASSYQVAIAGLLVMGLGVAWMSPNLSASAIDAVTPERRGRSLGIVRAAHSIAPAVGLAIFEPLAHRIGPKGVLTLVVILASLMMLAMAAQAVKIRTLGLQNGRRASAGGS
jgi:MFS family permease